MYKSYGWKFDDEVAKQFDNHVRQSVYMYDEFHNSIVNMSRFFIEDNTNILDIGTSTGELLKKLYNDKNNCNYIGIDIESPMIEQAKLKLPKQVRLEVGDILDYKIENCSIITMVLVLQFIRPKDKQLVIDNIYKSLNKGGAFFFVDKVKSPILDIHDMYNDLYYDFKLNNNLSHRDVLEKNISLRGVQKTITTEENLEIFKRAGFKNIDIFMKYNNFIGILAIK